jgi:hypothetical protein
VTRLRFLPVSLHGRLLKVAITTADGWFAAAKQKTSLIKTASAITIATVPFSLWDVAGSPGAGSLTIGNTANGLVPTDAVAGTPLINAFGVSALGYLASARYRSSVAGGATLYDRLFHAGSVLLNALATTTLTAQPVFTSRLPGGNDYSNTEILLEINAAVSATSTQVTVTYTNEAGVTGRSTGLSVSLSGFTTRRLVPMPLQAGDKGVQKIESIVVGGTVATAGSVNVVIARRLADFDVRVANGLDAQAWDLLGSPFVYADSALWLVSIPDGASSGLPTLMLDIING